MNEKVLIKSQRYNVKKVLTTFMIIGLLSSLILFIGLASADLEWYGENYDSAYERYREHQVSGECGDPYSTEVCHNCFWVWSTSRSEYLIEVLFRGTVWYSMLPAIGLTLIGLLIYLWLRSYELTVTDMRIYGKVAWGKRVDLPIDSISATAMIRMLRGISVSTSSGRISFRIIKNADEIYRVINGLLIKRQEGRNQVSVVETIPQSDEVEKLKKYKDLLDTGVITQEEFDAKKKQLLGL